MLLFFFLLLVGALCSTGGPGERKGTGSSVRAVQGCDLKRGLGLLCNCWENL